MEIIVFGAGYVGAVTGACLAHLGHFITFIEPDRRKVEKLNRGESPLREPGLEELISSGQKGGRIKAKTSLDNELIDGEMAMISVGTPSDRDGGPSIDQVERVFQTISTAINERRSKLIVALRSTIHPIALKKIMTNLSNKEKLSIVVHPEFLRESTAVKDFFNAPICVAGGEDPSAVNRVLNLYEGICKNVRSVDSNTACLLKYASNVFHAMKIAFANEMGTLCKALSLDPVKMMDHFCSDVGLNCSKAYLHPGFSFGGSCLPKDIRALLALSRELKVDLPLISSIIPSNKKIFHDLISEILYEGYTKVAVIGISFKKNTDDIRESPYVDIVESLIGKGVEVRAYDPEVKPHDLLGRNLEAFHHQKNHLANCFVPNLDAALNGCQAVIYCKDICPDELIAKLQNQKLVLYDINYHLPINKVQSTQNDSRKILA